MKRRALLLLLLGLCSLGQYSHGQSWSGVLAPARALADWSSAGVVGGIPSANWPVCTTLNPGVTAAQITSALASCHSSQPNGGVVMLASGTFNLTSVIDWHVNSVQKVVLRGAGPTKTKLVFTGGSPCTLGACNVWIGGNTLNIGSAAATAANWTGTNGSNGTYTVGATQLNLDNATGFSVGSMVAIDQINDNVDTGNILTCSTTSGDSAGFICSQQGGPIGGRNCPGSGGVGNTNQTCRAQHQWFQVTAISGNTLTVSPGVYHPNWRTSQVPQIWTAGVIGQNIGQYNGIENLNVDATGDSGSRSEIQISNCYSCWVLNVAGNRLISRNHVWIINSPHSEVRNSYFFGSQGTSQAYGIEVDYGSNELIVNNIIQHTTGAATLGGDVGGVYAYNFFIYDYTTTADYMLPDSLVHDAGSNYNLFEGNVSNSFGDDAIHGTQFFNTAFRNYFLGTEFGKTQQTIPVFMDAFNRYNNVVGNVLGAPSVTGSLVTFTQYEDAAEAGSNPNSSIYVLGWSNTGSDCCSTPGDTMVKSTLMRWGNYDVVNNGVRFVASENASSAPAYPGLSSPSQTLPASFFLSARPSWFGVAGQSTIPWPPVGPDVSGGNVGFCSGGTYGGIPALASAQCSGAGTLTAALGGHVNAIPAWSCYINVLSGPPDGTNSAPLSFDAAACYPATTNTSTAPPPASTATGR